MDIKSHRISVEQFHLLFLNQLGLKLDKKLYALKGGCNLRFFFNSFRYSEDIDIDVQTIAKDTLRNKVNKILSSQPFINILRANGLEIVTISEPKQTETTQRWKISIRESNQEITLPTKIEFSRRKEIQNVKYEVVNPEIIRSNQLTPIFACHYSAEMAFQQKVEALALRGQTQSRDVFDLFLLHSSGLVVQGKINKSKDLYKKAITSAMSLSFEDYQGQVVAYLTPEYQEQYGTSEMWENILLTVIGLLEEK